MIFYLKLSHDLKVSPLTSPFHLFSCFSSAGFLVIGIHLLMQHYKCGYVLHFELLNEWTFNFWTLKRCMKHAGWKCTPAYTSVHKESCVFTGNLFYILHDPVITLIVLVSLKSFLYIVWNISSRLTSFMGCFTTRWLLETFEDVAAVIATWLQTMDFLPTILITGPAMHQTSFVWWV